MGKCITSIEDWDYYQIREKNRLKNLADPKQNPSKHVYVHHVNEGETDSKEVKRLQNKINQAISKITKSKLTDKEKVDIISTLTSI